MESPELGQPAPRPNRSREYCDGAIIAFAAGATCFFPVAIVLGHMALNDIRESGGLLRGRRLAIAAMALGYSEIAAIAAMLLLLEIWGFPG